MQKKYTFYSISKCEMCGSPAASHKILGQRLNQSQGFRPNSKIGISVSIIKCTHCDLIYSNPLPIPNDIQDHYGIPPEQYWSPEIFTFQEGYFSSQISKFKEIAAFKNGMKALDVGAGLGRSILALNNAGFDTYGFEPSEPFHKRAIEKMGIKAERLKLGMIENLDYENDFFDFITFGAVLEHLYYPSQSINKAMKWLKKGGLIHIEVPSSHWFISKIYNIYYRLTGTNYVTHLSPMHEPYHMYEFGLKSFSEHAKQQGYEIAYYEYTVCDMPSIPKLFRPVLYQYMKATNKGMQLSVWLRKI
jgi:ubiquinone/menaquinone biosynthesis C-methylase UbiE